MSTKQTSGDRWLVVMGLGTCLLLMYWGRPILVPLCLALFLNAIILPSVRFLNRYISRWLGIITLLVLLSLFVMANSFIVFFHVSELTEKLPEYTVRFQSIVNALQEWLHQFGIQVHWNKMQTGDAARWLLKYLSSGIGSFVHFVTQTFLVIVFMIFLALENRLFQK
ncbi:MAG: AI-2E family transporter, partial [Myxococcota bacterium]